MYVLNGCAYRTKALVTDRIRVILYKHDFGSEVVGEDRDILLDLLNHHSDAAGKIGVGVARVEIRKALYGTRCFWIVREDGTVDDFSYLNCVDNMKKTEAAA